MKRGATSTCLFLLQTLMEFTFTSGDFRYACLGSAESPEPCLIECMKQQVCSSLGLAE